MFRLHSFDHGSRRGVALIIVLAFIVLVTGLVVAYLSRTTVDRQIAKSSFNDTTADLLARSALDILLVTLNKKLRMGRRLLIQISLPSAAPPQRPALHPLFLT